MISQFQLQKPEGVNGIIKTESKRNQEKGEKGCREKWGQIQSKKWRGEIIQNISVVTVNTNEQS